MSFTSDIFGNELHRYVISDGIRDGNVLAFDIYIDELLIGFAMVRKFDEGAYFLWNYAIDSQYQNQNYGTTALSEFICFMKDTYQ